MVTPFLPGSSTPDPTEAVSYCPSAALSSSAGLLMRVSFGVSVICEKCNNIVYEKYYEEDKEDGVSVVYEMQQYSI